MTRKRRSYALGYLAARSTYPPFEVSPQYARTVAWGRARKGASRWYRAGFTRGAMDVVADGNHLRAAGIDPVSIYGRRP